MLLDLNFLQRNQPSLGELVSVPCLWWWWTECIPLWHIVTPQRLSWMCTNVPEKVTTKIRWDYVKMTSKRIALGQGSVESYTYVKYRVISIIYNLNLRRLELYKCKNLKSYLLLKTFACSKHLYSDLLSMLQVIYIFRGRIFCFLELPGEELNRTKYVGLYISFYIVKYDYEISIERPEVYRRIRMASWAKSK